MPSSGGSVSDAPVNKVVDGKSHYLAYITPDEGQSLQQQGGQEVITNEGIPAYPPLGQAGTSPGTSSSGGGRDGPPGRSTVATHQPAAPAAPSPGSQHPVAQNRAPTQTGTRPPDFVAGATIQTGPKPGTTHPVITNRGETIKKALVETQDLGDPMETLDYDDAKARAILKAQAPDTYAGVKTGDAEIATEIALEPPDYSDNEIEKGYTDEGEKLSQVGAGLYMTKAEMYNKGLIEKDPETGEDVQGRNRINPTTGNLERTDLSFAEHWANRPDAIKYSPVLSFLYASGQNLSEWMSKNAFKGYNEAGLRTDKSLWDSLGDGGQGDGKADTSSAVSNAQSNFVTSGKLEPTNSVAANWYQNLGSSSISGPSGGFNLAAEYAAAKAKVAETLGTSSAIGQLAVNESPFYNWLKTNSLDRGIL